MAEVNANSLPAKTDLGTNDSAIVVDQTTNAGALVDLDVLADKVLDRITSKTFANQVGGSSAATLLAQLSTLNSKTGEYSQVLSESGIELPNATFTTVCSITLPAGVYVMNGCISIPETSAQGVRICMLWYQKTSSNTAANSVVATGRANLEKIIIRRTTSSSTWYLRAYQNSGSTLHVAGEINVVKIA